MSASVQIRIPDLPRLEVILVKLERRGDDMSPLMGRIGMYGESSTIERFETETAPDGSRWAPSIRARQEGGKTLTKSTRLKLSMTYIAGRDQVEWGTNVIYAGTHQDGATIRAKNAPRLGFRLPGGLGFRSPLEVTIPKREFLGLSGEDESEIVALSEDYFAEVWP